ncbi:hypothetical protein [Micromonospora sp. NPDC005299]|uniref:hypothetical protein n=1 Tax=Micromonospora sp. NPDC005299 TaxID=3364231 RepID=UPI00368BD3E2
MLTLAAILVHGNPPGVNASTDRLVSFYDGDRVRILISSVILGFAVLNLLWFAAAIGSTLRDAGQGIWARRRSPQAGHWALSSS